jgi:hypothetical protein
MEKHRERVLKAANSRYKFEGWLWLKIFTGIILAFMILLLFGGHVFDWLDNVHPYYQCAAFIVVTLGVYWITKKLRR